LLGAAQFASDFCPQRPPRQDEIPPQGHLALLDALGVFVTHPIRRQKLHAVQDFRMKDGGKTGFLPGFDWRASATKRFCRYHGSTVGSFQIFQRTASSQA
jgi:hypothetical protein